MAIVFVSMGMLACSGWAVAQDSASPNTNMAQSMSEHRRTEATARESGPNGTKSTEANGSSPMLSPRDKAFLRNAAQADIEEVELGNVVAGKTQNSEVKQFAERMVHDHSQANQKLKSLAQQRRVQLPTQMDAKGKALKARLEKLSGAQLNQVYMRNMVENHTKDVQKFKTVSQTAPDNSVRQFASAVLPTLESHLQEAEQIAPNVGVNVSQAQRQAESAEK